MKYIIFTLFALISFNSQAIETIKNTIGMEFVKIPAGNFNMGTKDLVDAQLEFPEADENTARDETPAHRVVISKPYLMGKTEVTQQQWLTVMENRPGDTWKKKDWQNYPVGDISWFMAKRFTQELSKLDKNYNYRLPTEAEWEYAARGGNDDVRPAEGDDMQKYAWFIESSNDHAHPVATRKANAFGLHDMFGNVWEWVDDWYSSKTYERNAKQAVDPKGPEKGFSKVKRGGSYHCPMHMMRFAHRGGNKPQQGFVVDGFRVVAEAK